ncbi:VOC family protein [Pseudoalteromonas mariniglutinosa]
MKGVSTLAIKHFLKPLLLSGALAAVLTGCQLTQPSLPAISDSGTKQLGHVVWHDLVTPDLKQSQTFYQAVFDWQFRAVNDDYVLVSTNGQVIAGMAKLDNKQNNSHWLALVSVADVDSVINSTRSAGGKTLIGKTTITGRGDIAVLEDPQGALFSVINTVNGDPSLTINNNSWIWQEVWSDDPAASSAFYQQLAGYSTAQKTLFGANYSFLKINSSPAFGFVKKPDAEIGNTWVNYIKVADVDATILKVTAAGGQVLMAPNDAVRNGTVAIIRDPAGAGLVIQETTK